MTNFTILNELPILDLYTEFNRLIDNDTINWFQYSDGRYVRDQICINSIKGREEDIFYGRGSLLYDWDQFYFTDKGELKAPVRTTRLRERDFTELCTQFKGTLFEETYNALTERYTVGRIRLMNSKPKSCLTWHTDNTTRIHYPIKTQEGCFMVIADEVKYLETNIWYHTNTLSTHSAFNGSKDERLHLVVNLIDEKF
jgi:hypothetical protein|tara:strand:- start:40 stop:633 length:594 start_codon:yes stop_codon:yes gene_type:complete